MSKSSAAPTRPDTTSETMTTPEVETPGAETGTSHPVATQAFLAPSQTCGGKSPSEPEANSNRRLVLLLAGPTARRFSATGADRLAGLLVTSDHLGPKDVAARLHGEGKFVPSNDGGDGKGLPTLPLTSETLRIFADRIHLVVTHGSDWLRRTSGNGLDALSSHPWICSRRGVDWRQFGVADTNLEAILTRIGLSFDPSSPVGMCHGLLNVLRADTWPRFIEPPFAHLLRNVALQRVRVEVSGPTYDHRDALKRRGYRWSEGTGRIARGWFVTVPRSSGTQEVAWINWRLGAEGIRATLRETSVRTAPDTRTWGVARD